MKGHWADWIAVGLAVAGAAAWLVWRIQGGKQRDFHVAISRNAMLQSAVT